MSSLVLALLLTFFSALLGSCIAHASQPQLLVLASQRNAETIAEAARLFHQQHPQLKVIARTDTQLWEMNPAAQQQLIDSSSLVLGIGLFGASVAELESRFRHSKTPRLLYSSDDRLMQMSQLYSGPMFNSQEQLRSVAGMHHGTGFEARLAELQARYPQQAQWIAGRRYWQAGGADNAAQLFAWAYAQMGQTLAVAEPQPLPRLRWQYRGATSAQLPTISAEQPLLVILDHAGGDRPADSALLQQTCDRARSQHNLECLVALAYWGEAGVEAAQQLQNLKAPIAAVVMLQDFVVGGGEGRELVTEQFTQRNVPVIKAIKLRDRTALEWQLSSDGLANDKVYYQVAMPELQGASQPLVMATAGEQSTDAFTGIRVQPIAAHSPGIDTLLARAANWQKLRSMSNADKRVAIVYYNHPPGRHNIGADNLDVPASLFQILTRLKAEGYNTGPLPDSPAALLDQIQARGINLPNDQQALQSMSREITRIDTDHYRQWFNTLPAAVQSEVVDGPLGRLQEQLQQTVDAGHADMAQVTLDHTMEEVRHLLEGVDHPGRQRALALVEQLQRCYQTTLEGGTPCWEQARKIISALRHTGIEGLGGWGTAPGKVMTVDRQMLLPGLRIGNVFIGPQPPRGWEVNEELLHANLAFPPPHQYLAFYQFLQQDFKADAIVHLGRHSTYEFLPHRSVGLAEDDYSRIMASNIPGIYPYIVDGVGEGIQAKRRGLAVMIDHLTPPLESTPLYDDLLQLRQLIESFEASHGNNNALSQRLVQQIRAKVDALELKEELSEAMSAELAVMGISFDEVDDDMLVHEVGHYLTDLQERFMPYGLHVFGRDWERRGIDKMLASMAPDGDEQQQQWQQLLSGSPAAEMRSLLNALDGGFVAPGPGNDPIRSPAALPTGRNFYALDNSLIPSPVAWELGQELAQEARKNNPQNSDKREALVLWASDVVRDEGVMIAFGLDMLGLKPIWNSRGLVKGLQRQELADERVRRDVVFTTSGLFRDLYSRQMLLLDQATLIALQASANTIVRDHPALTQALYSALQPLQDSGLALDKAGSESLQQNQVAAHWVKEAQQLLAAGTPAEKAGALASLRVFGDAPGSYGAGVNRLVERSGAWQQRSELAEVYLRRLGHSFSSGNGSGFGAPAQAVFRTLLSDVENTYLGRSSNLYGLIDNNDAFDYLGGLSLAVETLTGTAPNNFVLNHADPDNIKSQPLALALRQELRGRFLNPEWLKGLMEHDYAGARTMGSEFLEYLWGWQVTNPGLVGDWAWEEVKSVYVDDRYELQLDEFLEQGHNVHVKSNMLAIMLVAIHKEFWNADQQTREQLAGEFARLVLDNGLPGSGHTSPDNPMLQWVQHYLPQEQQQALQTVIDKAKGQQAEAEPELHRATEIELQDAQPSQADNNAAQASENSDPQATSNTHYYWLLLVILAVIAAGYYRTSRHSLLATRD
ncbi:cobaltochelatase subunit CobN [Pseudomaricurvus sp. HS19]|uniref:cobaltochelatase subunit CobN n=1 Tax=Pseudomaricurvus sp. HS19 TaxID=2692626 RepID=UPI001F33C4C7|nr:cobaltochelatase subunit CobN [Pseudomaricurvus sp. HS19]